MAEFELQTAVLSGDGGDDDGYMTRHQRRRWAGFDRFFRGFVCLQMFPFPGGFLRRMLHSVVPLVWARRR